MTAVSPSSDAIAESQRLIAALEQHRSDLPFADAALETHRTMHRELEEAHSASAQAVLEWRAALARRWDCEVSGRRLYKQVLRQLIEHYGEEDGPVKLISRGGAEAESTPAELLEDLRRLGASLTIAGMPPAIAERAPQIEAECLELARAIGQVSTCEHRRRQTVLDDRMVREVYRRVRGETSRTLALHYGPGMPAAFGSLLEEP